MLNSCTGRLIKIRLLKIINVRAIHCGIVERPLRKNAIGLEVKLLNLTL